MNSSAKYPCEEWDSIYAGKNKLYYLFDGKINRLDLVTNVVDSIIELPLKTGRILPGNCHVIVNIRSHGSFLIDFTENSINQIVFCQFSFVYLFY
jgi:hypothetical protein